jgi:hypothetical protein
MHVARAVRALESLIKDSQGESAEQQGEEAKDTEGRILRILRAQVSPIAHTEKGPVFAPHVADQDGVAEIDVLFAPPLRSPYAHRVSTELHAATELLPPIVLRLEVDPNLGLYSLPRINVLGNGMSPQEFHLCFTGNGKMADEVREQVETAAMQEVIGLLSDETSQDEEDALVFGAVFRGLDAMFQEPPHPCDSCQRQFNFMSTYHATRMAAVASYSAHCLHPELFAFNRYPAVEETPRPFPSAWLDPALATALGPEGDLRSVLTELHPGKVKGWMFVLVPDPVALFSDSVCRYSACRGP